MRLMVNGDWIQSRAETVSALLEELGVNAPAVAVEVNLAIVKKKDFGTFALKEEDRVEIVNFVGGG
ncbi:MAG: sulfur carrier protein ThiS [Nitrospiraceae bacterium]|nr:sulfur carrier protein ThiS [Nitrospiraceae bacterium]